MKEPQKATPATSPSTSPAAMTQKVKKTHNGRGECFEFCDVCNLNHDQGRRHKYYPAHRRALADALSRFLKKLSDLRFFVRNPSLLRAEHAALNRIWCVFCTVDIREIGSNFVCGTAIRHLASEEHYRNMKRFLWKHGEGIERVDSFRVSEADLMKWENGCEALKTPGSTSIAGLIGPALGPSKDIQFEYELNSNTMDCFENKFISSFSSDISRPVLPLQSFTNENYQVFTPDGNGSVTAAHVLHGTTPLSIGVQRNVGLDHIGGFESVARHLKGAQVNHVGIKGNGGSVLTVVKYGPGADYRESNGVLQMLTQIALPSEGSQANVHTGGLPPWLDICDEREESLVNCEAHINNHAPSKQKGKSRKLNSKRGGKLNPKRVGAAWSEKRRIELEMEKRGEIILDSFDTNWLPNFGRVWHAGSRKESKKEFEMEKHKLVKVDMHSESSIKLQPYISKRMRTASSSKFETVDPCLEQQRTELF